MGWSFPWASSSGYDFNVSLTEEQERAGASRTTSASRPCGRRLRRCAGPQPASTSRGPGIKGCPDPLVEF